MDRARTALLPLAIAVPLVVLGEHDGGWFSTSWGWADILALCVAGGLAATGPIVVGRLELVFAGGLAALVGWAAISLVWTISIPQTVDEVTRDIAYPAAVLAIALAARRAAPVVLGTALAASELALHGLFDRLFPDVQAGLITGDGRLAGPVTYANGEGTVAVLAALLLLAFVLHARRELAAVAAAFVVPSLLTLYFTFSRGAWAAGIAGLAVLLALTPRRPNVALLIAPLLPLAAVAMWAASRSDPLTRGFPTPAAAHDGHRLALLTAGLALVGGVFVFAVRPFADRLALPTLPRRAVLATTAAAAVLVLAVGLVRTGGPVAAARTFWSSFQTAGSNQTAPVGHGTFHDPRQRLFSLNGSARALFWQVAADEVRAHPLVGSGAGTFAPYWLQHRTQRVYVQDAHNLYLETFAELGAVGLLLLLVAVAAPALAAVRARRVPYVAAAAAAYAAYLVEAAADWTWELPAITLIGIAAGAAVLVQARGEPVRAARLRLAIVVPCALALVFAFDAYVGNTAIARAEHAATHGSWPAVGAPARLATRVMPWDDEGWRLRAEYALSAGDGASAVRFLRDAVARDPGDYRLWVRLAQLTSSPSERRRARATAHRLDPLDIP